MASLLQRDVLPDQVHDVRGLRNLLHELFREPGQTTSAEYDQEFTTEGTEFTEPHTLGFGTTKLDGRDGGAVEWPGKPQKGLGCDKVIRNAG